MAHSGKDIVFSVDGGGVTVNAAFGFSYLAACFIQGIGLDEVHGTIGQLGDFVLVVADGESSLPTPVLGLDYHGIYVEVNAGVLQCTVIGPHVRKAGDVADGLAGEQVGSLAVEIFNAEVQAVGCCFLYQDSTGEPIMYAKYSAFTPPP